MALWGHVAYFVVLGTLGIVLATRRLKVLFFD